VGQGKVLKQDTVNANIAFRRYFDHVELRDKTTKIPFIGREYVWESGFDALKRVSGSVAGYSILVRKIKRAQIISSQNVIGVGVGVEDRVHTPDFMSETLMT
jgi:hypothetical protein